MKIVINRCYGGFELSPVAQARFAEITGRWLNEFGYDAADHHVERDDIALVRVVEELDAKASTELSELAVVEIPDNVEWWIEDYDGAETIHEAHRVWG